MFKDLALRVCITFNEATKIHVKLSLMRFILSTSFQKHFLPNFELPNLKCSLISASCAYAAIFDRWDLTCKSLSFKEM